MNSTVTGATGPLDTPIDPATELNGFHAMCERCRTGSTVTIAEIAGRVGGAVSAELGTMRVTEQIDALRVMGADPIDYLVVPRGLTWRLAPDDASKEDYLILECPGPVRLPQRSKVRFSTSIVLPCP